MLCLGYIALTYAEGDLFWQCRNMPVLHFWFHEPFALEYNPPLKDFLTPSLGHQLEENECLSQDYHPVMMVQRVLNSQH